MRRLLLSLLGVTGFVAPSTALAAGYNNVRFDVASNGAWTYEPGGVVRHKTDYGSMKLNLNDTTDGGVCVRVISTRTTQQFGNVVCYGPGEYGVKTVATNVLAGTNFRVQAHKRIASGSNNHWGAYYVYFNSGGWFYY